MHSLKSYRDTIAVTDPPGPPAAVEGGDRRAPRRHRNGTAASTSTTATAAADAAHDASNVLFGPPGAGPSAWRWAAASRHLLQASAMKRHRFSFYGGLEPLLVGTSSAGTAWSVHGSWDDPAAWITDACVLGTTRVATCASLRHNVYVMSRPAAQSDEASSSSGNGSLAMAQTAITLPSPSFGVAAVGASEVLVTGRGQVYRIVVEGEAAGEYTAVLPDDTYEETRLVSPTVMPDNLALATVYIPSSRALDAWDLTRQRRRWTLPNAAGASAMHPASAVFAYTARALDTCGAPVVRLWDPRTRAPSRYDDVSAPSIGRSGDAVETLLWSASSHTLWTGGDAVAEWDLRAPTHPVVEFSPPHTHRVAHVALLAPGLVATADYTAVHVTAVGPDGAVPCGSLAASAMGSSGSRRPPATVTRLFATTTALGGNGAAHASTTGASSMLSQDSAVASPAVEVVLASGTARTLTLPMSTCRFLGLAGGSRGRWGSLNVATPLGSVLEQQLGGRRSRSASAVSCTSAGGASVAPSIPEQVDEEPEEEPAPPIPVGDVEHELARVLELRDAVQARRVVPPLLLALDLDLFQPSPAALRNLCLLVLKHQYTEGLELGLHLVEWQAARARHAGEPLHGEWTTLVHWLLFPTVYDEDPALDEERRREIRALVDAGPAAKSPSPTGSASGHRRGKPSISGALGTGIEALSARQHALQERAGSAMEKAANAVSHLVRRKSFDGGRRHSASASPRKEDSAVTLPETDQKLHPPVMPRWKSVDDARRAVSDAKARAQAASASLLGNPALVVPMLRTALHVQLVIGTSADDDGDETLDPLQRATKIADLLRGVRSVSATVLRTYLYALERLGAWDEYLYAAAEMVATYQGFDFAESLSRHVRQRVLPRIAAAAAQVAEARAESVSPRLESLLVTAARIARFCPALARPGVLHHDVVDTLAMVTSKALGALYHVAPGPDTAAAVYRVLARVRDQAPPYIPLPSPPPGTKPAAVPGLAAAALAKRRPASPMYAQVIEQLEAFVFDDAGAAASRSRETSPPHAAVAAPISGGYG
ncbi:hypothetical protein H9P43_009190 [Blastocladiella emersonii ATCC 22665]|nr:hypothetical protein H9P43_009190 [Blastocladiella emersonii ATCC 22665]